MADSEPIAIAVAAAYANELGYRLSLDKAFETFVGRRASEVRGLIEAHTGKSVPDFEARLIDRTVAAFAQNLRPIAGIQDFIAAHEDIPRCIASSSAHRRLHASLVTIGLADQFAGRVFSADDVSRGKPFPDLFLFAANKMGIVPASALVIEDSPHGVEAARAAGMMAIGLVAGGHVAEDLGGNLMRAGALTVVQSYEELSMLLKS